MLRILAGSGKSLQAAERCRGRFFEISKEAYTGQQFELGSAGDRARRCGRRLSSIRSSTSSVSGRTNSYALPHDPYPTRQTSSFGSDSALFPAGKYVMIILPRVGVVPSWHRPSW